MEAVIIPTRNIIRRTWYGDKEIFFIIVDIFRSGSVSESSISFTYKSVATPKIMYSEKLNLNPKVMPAIRPIIGKSQ
jgi:hypothetical protein